MTPEYFARVIELSGHLSIPVKEAAEILSGLSKPEQFYLAKRMIGIWSWGPKFERENEVRFLHGKRVERPNPNGRPMGQMGAKDLEQYVRLAKQYASTNSHHIHFEETEIKMADFKKNPLETFKNEIKAGKLPAVI